MTEKKICKQYYIDNDYPVDFTSEIPPELRDSSPYTQIPRHEPNGGLYRGPQINKWFVPHEVVPTTTYFNKVLLKNTLSCGTYPIFFLNSFQLISFDRIPPM